MRVWCASVKHLVIPRIAEHFSTSWWHVLESQSQIMVGQVISRMGGGVLQFCYHLGYNNIIIINILQFITKVKRIFFHQKYKHFFSLDIFYQNDVQNLNILYPGPHDGYTFDRCCES